MREKLDYHQNADDGTFWMDYNFAKNIFKVYTVGPMNGENRFSFLKVAQP
jgi:hypothetical protein